MACAGRAVLTQLPTSSSSAARMRPDGARLRSAAGTRHWCLEFGMSAARIAVRFGRQTGELELPPGSTLEQFQQRVSLCCAARGRRGEGGLPWAPLHSRARWSHASVDPPQVEALTGVPVKGQKLLGPLGRLTATDVVDASAARGKPVTIIGTTRSRAKAAARADAAVLAAPADPPGDAAARPACADDSPTQLAAASASAAPPAPAEVDWVSEAAAVAAAPIPPAALHRLAEPRSRWTVVVDVEGVLTR